jgi:hypothetical protein
MIMDLDQDPQEYMQDHDIKSAWGLVRWLHNQDPHQYMQDHDLARGLVSLAT